MKSDILKCWRDIEIFDIPDFNKNARTLPPHDLLPWLEEQPKLKKNYKYQYTLIFGKIDKKCIFDCINSFIKADSSVDWEGKIHGYSTLAALQLDENGRPEQNSYVRASYTFGMGALQSNVELHTVSKAIEKSRADYVERYHISISIPAGENTLIQGDVVEWRHLYNEIAYLKEVNSWLETEIGIYLLIEEIPVYAESNTTFLNSFYLNDLNELAAFETKELGLALQEYLSLKPLTKGRKDVIKNKNLFFETFNPDLLTLARWPTNPSYGFYSAQTGAVNTIVSNLRNKAGIQGVNGPPGTGKTTLLQDVIAEIIVERAKILVELGCENIFEKGYTKIEKESGFSQYTYTLNHRLQRNFGIVVASNNNAAVENISKELPLKSKIDKNAFPDADYFSDNSKLLIDQESWGVLAAALGNTKNRRKFKKAFWDTNENGKGFHDLLYDIYKKPETDTAQEHLKSFKHHKKEFYSLLDCLNEFKKVAAHFHQQLPFFIENTRKLDQAEDDLKNVIDELSKLYKDQDILIGEEANCTKEADRIQTLLLIHRDRKPSFFFFQKLIKTRDFIAWNKESDEIIFQAKNLQKALKDLKLKIEQKRTIIQSLSTKENECKNKIQVLNKFFNDYQNLEEKLVNEYEIDRDNLFTVDMFEKNIETIHLLNPYHSTKVAKWRSRLFIEALHIHQEAILYNAKNIRNNLSSYFEMASGRAKVNEAISQNLWDTFFLCVPVVSTTLASASRLFPGMNKDQIGWLLIDEAGQATPQSAVGLIHRSKRCIIVGDPLQVEPVVTIPEKLVTKLRNEYGVGQEWSPYKVSVQQLADRISLIGTWMKVGESEEEIWTGFPLRTHRRCNDPMFSIANTIAYSNQMVKPVVDSSKAEPARIGYIGASRWFDERDSSQIIDKHVIKAEIDCLERKIKELEATGYGGDIYVISPFKSIASYCKNLFSKNKNVLCGTIHTFQGKEADVVFLILGSDPNVESSRKWASEKPNMLNVALTRAKKRFYVIGNKELWASCTYFETMAKVLK